MLDCQVVQKQFVILNAADYQFCIQVVACQRGFKNWLYVRCDQV
jgi:hypothetical protein